MVEIAGRPVDPAELQPGVRIRIKWDGWLPMLKSRTGVVVQAPGADGQLLWRPDGLTASYVALVIDVALEEAS